MKCKKMQRISCTLTNIWVVRHGCWSQGTKSAQWRNEPFVCAHGALQGSCSLKAPFLSVWSSATAKLFNSLFLMFCAVYGKPICFPVSLLAQGPPHPYASLFEAMSESHFYASKMSNLSSALSKSQQEQALNSISTHSSRTKEETRIVRRNTVELLVCAQ